MQFECYFEAAELEAKPKKTQVAILLHSAGPEAQDIAQKFDWIDGEDKTNYKHVLKKFKDYLDPKCHESFEGHRFWSRDQRDGESADQWITELKTLLANCGYACNVCNCTHITPKILRDKIVAGVKERGVRERLLRDSDLTLPKAVDIVRAAEVTKAQMAAMSASGSDKAKDVHAVHKGARPKQPSKPKTGYNKHSQSQGPPKSKSSHSQSSFVEKCEYCGRSHRKGKCPAFGQQCNKCSGWNHYASECKGGGFRKKVYTAELVESEGATEDQTFYIRSVESERAGKGKFYANLKVSGDSIEFKIDTGSDASILPKKVYTSMRKPPLLGQTHAKLKGFGDAVVRPLGCFKVPCSRQDGETQEVTFYVTDRFDIPLIGEDDAYRLGLVVPLNVGHVCSSTEEFMERYPDVFSGLGEYSTEYHIELKPGSEGVIQAPRRVPYALQDKLKKKLDQMQQDGVIADVDQPTDWVSNLVIAQKKDSSLRLCLDPKPLNEAIKRENYMIPTPQDVLSKLSGKKVFTVIDMKNAYWHVKLSEESSYLTTFHTPWGRKRFLRMPFGISSASEVMQKRNHETFGDIPGVHVIADDLIIGTDNDDENDEVLEKVLQRARSRKVKFNEDKIQYKLPYVHYMGNIVSHEGLKPDEAKVKAIVDMPTPTDVPGLQRLLGMVKYLAAYIPRESEITAPLRQLLRKDTEWSWQYEHDRAVQRLKDVLTSAPVLAYYDVKKGVTIQADASQSGLGACLMQSGKPIAYASRSMTSAECNYAQIEKELLAITFACNKFHQYICGKEGVNIMTDHRPLESILKKPLNKAPPRLQRLMLRLQPYDLVVKYVPGKYMYVADTLSRAYLADQGDAELEQELDMAVRSLVMNTPVSAAKRTEIIKCTEQDEMLCLVKKYIQHGWPRRGSLSAEMQSYFDIRDELHLAEGVIYYGERMVIPKELRGTMLKLVHETHQGIEKCKARARTVLYWPNMSKDIEQKVSECSVCLKYRNSHPKEPMIPHDIPDGRYEKVAMDIMTYGSRDYLVIVDYYSKYPELALLDSKTAETMVTHCKCAFARHGIPKEIVSDNMPFNSYVFKQFAEEWGIKLSFSSPGYAQSNGQAERFVQTIKRMLMKAHEDGRDPYLALLEFRNTPITGMKQSPAELLMSRQLRAKLPTSDALLHPRVHDAYDELRLRQQLQKGYYDRGSRSHQPLKPGDTVRVQRGKVWERGQVQNLTPSAPRSYEVRSGGNVLRRNRRFLFRSNEPGVSSEVHCGDNASDVHDSVDTAPTAPTATPTVVAASVPMATVPESYTTRSGRHVKVPMRYMD